MPASSAIAMMPPAPPSSLLSPAVAPARAWATDSLAAGDVVWATAIDGAAATMLAEIIADVRNLIRILPPFGLARHEHATALRVPAPGPMDGAQCGDRSGACG